MAYSTQNMYPLLDIIPIFVKKMFPFSLKTYPSCTNPMAWDMRDEIRSAYILRMVHQRDNQNTIIDGRAYKRDNISYNVLEEDGCGRPTPQCRHREVLFSESHLFTPGSSRSEDLLYITNMDNIEPVPKTASHVSVRKLSQSQINRIQSVTNAPKSLYRKRSCNRIDNVKCKTSSILENCSSGQTIQLVMASPSQTSTVDQHSPKSSGKTEIRSPIRREYQLLAQKFHQYTINCRTTIRTLEKKLKKLIDDKHALLHSMVSMRKGQKDVIKKYRRIFNDSMNEHCNEINALLANYKVIRDNYLELLQHDTSVTNSNQKEEVISVSYTSYNCC